MRQPPPDESARDAARIAQVKRVIQRRGLGGLANDTKWEEFIVGIRTLFGIGQDHAWHPSYRFKLVDGEPSGWDVEWWYHLPYLKIAVEWFDVAHLQEVRDQRMPPNIRVIDHGPRIVELLQRVGLAFEVGKTMIRVFGYAPKNMDEFDA
jgi:hypothetical protein